MQSFLVGYPAKGDLALWRNHDIPKSGAMFFFTFRKEQKLATRISSQQKNKISPKPLVFELNF